MLTTLLSIAALASPAICFDGTALEASGTWLGIVSGELVRRRAGKIERLHSIDPDALGRVLDISADRAGAVFVVSDRGLWIGWDEMDILDRVEPIEDAPRGEPTSVFVDSNRRVWLATSTTVGLLDPVYFFGRTLPAVASECGDGPYTVRGSTSGKPLFRGSSGELELDPDEGDPPSLISLRSRGRDLEPDEELVSRHGEPLEIVARGSSRGDITYRYRLDHDPVWLPFAGALQLVGTPPGRHRLEILAEDAGLRRSAPFSVKLAVGLPFYYEPKFVAIAGLLVGIGLITFFFRRYRSFRPNERRIRAALSSAVAGVLFLQVLAGITGHAAGWPFVGYTMYATSYSEGDCTYRMMLVGTEPSGSRREIPFGALRAATDDPRSVFSALIDGGDDGAHEFVAEWNARVTHQPLVGVAVHSERVRLTADGPVRVAPLVHFSWPRDVQ